MIRSAWTHSVTWFAAAALAFAVGAGTGGSGSQDTPATRFQSVTGHFTWFLFLAALCCFFAGCVKLREEAAVANSAERRLLWSGPARFAILTAVSLLLCFGLCSVGSQFGQPWTFSPLHNAEAGFGFVCFFAGGLYGLGTLVTLGKVWNARRQERRSRP